MYITCIIGAFLLSWDGKEISPNIGIIYNIYIYRLNIHIFIYIM